MSPRASTALPCPPPTLLARRGEGDLTPAELLPLEEHLGRCPRCRREARELEAITRLLARGPLDGSDELFGEPMPDLAPLVLARAALPPPRRALLRPALVGLSLAAALAVGVLVGGRLLGGAPAAAPAPALAALDRAAPPTGLAGPITAADDPAFQARGAGDDPAAAADRWVALHAYLAAEPAVVPLEAGATLGAQPLLFAYDNGGPDPYPYLVIVGRDASGAVHRYFPDDQPGARALVAEAGRARELHEEVCFALPPGPLRLIAVFSRAPLLVDEVAAAARRARPGERLALRGTGQDALDLVVGAPRPGARTCDGQGHGR